MFTDPFIQFIVTVIISIASAVLPFLLYFWKQHQTKEFVYEIVTNTSVLKISSEYKDSLKIIYKDIPVKDVRLILIKFSNSGNVPIETNHFDQKRPVRIIFSGDSAKILTCEVSDKFPENLDVKIQQNTNQVNISPALLNSGDTFSIKLLVSDFLGKITIDGRIVGVREIKEVKETINKNFRKSLVVSIIKMPIVIGRLIFDLFGRTEATETSALLVGIIFIVVALLFATGILDMPYFLNLLADLWRVFFPMK